MSGNGKPLRVMVAIPQTTPYYMREFTESYTHAKAWLFENAHLLTREIAIAEYFCHTFPIDANRNECIARAIENNIDVIIFLDTDQEFPRETLFKLLRHNLPIVAGIYHAKGEPYYPIVYKESEKSVDFDLFNSVTSFPEKELFEADMIGMGVCAIRREVWESLDKPYFKYGPLPKILADENDSYKFKIENKIECATEDVAFWRQVKKKGWKIVIDPTIDVQHITSLKVGRKLWKNYVQVIKNNIRLQQGEEALKAKEAAECKAEPIKKASFEEISK